MVLSGEGSDEVFGGYLYFHKAPNAKELHEKTIPRSYRHCIAALTAPAPTSDVRTGRGSARTVLDKNSLDVACVSAHRIKCAATARMEKHVLRECFESYLPASVAWRQKEQFSDGVGYSWIDTALKKWRRNRFSDQQRPPASAFRHNTPSSKGVLVPGNFLRITGAERGECVLPADPSVACSSAKAIEWDEAFKTMDDRQAARSACISRRTSIKLTMTKRAPRGSFL